MDEGANAVGSEAEHAIAHPVDEGAVVEKQEHRRQETHKRRKQPQETKALPRPIPDSEDHREERKDREQDQEHEALHNLHRVRDMRGTEPDRRYQQVDAEQYSDTNPR